MTLMAIHLKLWDRLMDPTGLKDTKHFIDYKNILGILICNFLFLNLGMSILQFPFSSSSSFATRFV